MPQPRWRQTLEGQPIICLPDTLVAVLELTWTLSISPRHIPLRICRNEGQLKRSDG